MIKGGRKICSKRQVLVYRGGGKCWALERKGTFQDVCMAVSREPVLNIMWSGYPFVLFIDASRKGLGACLSQVTPEGKRPIQYAAN